MCSVFFMQPVGQLLGNVVAIVAVMGWKPWIEQEGALCKTVECVRVIDRLWRLVVGLGAVPALVALAFRFTIPESPRYKMDVKRKIKRACVDMNDFYGRESDEEAVRREMEVFTGSIKAFDCQHEMSEGTISPVLRPSSTAEHQVEYPPIIRPASSEVAPDDILPIDLHYDHDHANINYFVHNPIDVDDHDVASTHSTTTDEPPFASRADIKKFFITEGNWRYLLGTSLSWLFLDFAFYGLGLSSPTIIREIWYGNTNSPSLYNALLDNSTHALIMVSIGALIGGAAMIKVIKYASPKVIQLWGFMVLTVLFIVIGSAWSTLLEGGRQTGLIVLFVLAQIVFNLGPNVTTFIVSPTFYRHLFFFSFFFSSSTTIKLREANMKLGKKKIPAEIFPTRYRCTCHGIAAAAGKLGSWVAQLFLAFAFKRGDGIDQEKEWLGHVLQV